MYTEEEINRLIGENKKLKSENYRLCLLDRQKCGGCGEPLYKNITLCKECVDNILNENTKLRELMAFMQENSYKINSCLNCKNNQNGNIRFYCDKYSAKVKPHICDNWQWEHADKLKELGINLEE